MWKSPVSTRFWWVAAVLTVGCVAPSGPSPASSRFSTPQSNGSAADAPDVDFQLRERRYRFDAEGRLTDTTHLVYRVMAAEPHEVWKTVSATWRPELDERPIIEARVIAPDGTSATLDQTTLVETAVKSQLEDIFSDAKQLSAPLPLLRPGVLVDLTITSSERRSLTPWGVAVDVRFALQVPLAVDRLDVEAPASLKLQGLVEHLPEKLVRTEQGGTVRLHLERKKTPVFEPNEPLTPPEEAVWPRVIISTGASWNAVAKGYGAAVAPRFVLTEALKAKAKSLTAGARTDAEKVSQLLSFVRREVRYTGLEVQDASIVPALPAEVTARRYGDCKDMSTLLVTMLREVGVEARLALLSASWLPDVPEQLPGSGHFNHAIVYVPSTKQWVDPTQRFAAPGQLGSSSQGRRALIIDDSTQALVTTSVAQSTDSTLRATYEGRFARHGKGSIVRTRETRGLAVDEFRGAFYANADEYRRVMQVTTKDSYGGQVDAGIVSVGDPLDVAHDFVERLEVPVTTWVRTSLVDAAMTVEADTLIRALPIRLPAADAETPTDPEEREALRRKHTLVVPDPYVAELVFKASPPPGYVMERLPEPFTERIGPLSVSSTATQDTAGRVTMTVRLDSGPRRYSAADVELIKKELPRVLARIEELVFQNQPMQLLKQGKAVEALKLARALVAAEPKEPMTHLTLASVLLSLHAGQQARAEAKQAVTLAPGLAVAHRELGRVLMHDALGRYLEPGFDRTAAEAALRKAVTLDGDDTDTHAWLIDALLADDQGRLFRPGHVYGPALEALSAFRKKHGSAHDSLYARVLVSAGLSSRLCAEAPELTLDAQGRAAWFAALVVERGARGAFKQLDREKALEGYDAKRATELLLYARRYPAVNELVALEAQRTGERPSRQEQLMATLVSRLKPVDPNSFAPDDLNGFMPRMAAVQFGLSNDLDGLLMPGDAKLRAAYVTRLRAAMEKLERGSMPPTMLADMLVAMMHLERQSLGFAELVRLESRELPGATSELFLARTPKGWRIHPATWDLSALADALVATPAASTVLLRQLSSEDQVVWVRTAANEARRTPTAMPALVAVMHAFGSKPAAGLDTLRTAMTEARSSDVRAAYAVAVMNIHERLDQWEALRAHADGLMKDPDLQKVGRIARSIALTKLGRHTELREGLEAELKQNPDDLELLARLATAARLEGRYDLSKQARERLLELKKGAAEQLVELSFESVFTSVDAAAVERVEKADRISTSPVTQSTLALLYAERGQLDEAFEVFTRRINGTPTEGLGNRSWFAMAKLAEGLQLEATAVEAYRKVISDEHDNDRLHGLAQKRLAKLAP